MKTLSLLLGALLAATPVAPAAVAYYYGPSTSGDIQSGGAGTLVNGNALMVVDLDAFNNGANYYFLVLSSPSVQAGKSFDYRQFGVFNAHLRSLTNSTNIGVTFITFGDYLDQSGTTYDIVNYYSGFNITVPLSSASSATRSVPGSLTGQFTSITTTSKTAGTATVKMVSLQMLLAPTQAANAQGKSLPQALSDAKAYYDSIGGHLVQ